MRALGVSKGTAVPLKYIYVGPLPAASLKNDINKSLYVYCLLSRTLL